MSIVTGEYPCGAVRYEVDEPGGKLLIGISAEEEASWVEPGMKRPSLPRGRPPTRESDRTRGVGTWYRHRDPAHEARLVVPS